MLSEQSLKGKILFKVGLYLNTDSFGDLYQESCLIKFQVLLLQLRNIGYISTVWFLAVNDNLYNTYLSPTI